MATTITPEYVAQVKAAIRAVTYILRHPTQYTMRDCEDLRSARKQAMDLLDQLCIELAKQETEVAMKEKMLSDLDDIPF